MGNRIFYACQGLALDGKLLRGLQNISTNSDIKTYTNDIFGSIGSYVSQDSPSVTVSVTKILGGNDRTIYSGTITDNIDPTRRKNLCLFIGDEVAGFIGNTVEYSGRTEPNIISFSGAFISSAAYSLSTDSNLTESIDFVSYSRSMGSGSFCGLDIIQQDATDVLPTLRPVGFVGGGSEGISARQHVKSTNMSGPGNLTGFDIQTSFSRQPVEQFAKGYIDPKYSYVITPVETNLSFTISAIKSSNYDRLIDVTMNDCSGDYLNPAYSNNFFVEMCNGIKFNVNNCYFQGMVYGGGDAGGGNVEITYNYTCYNGFEIENSG